MIFHVGFYFFNLFFILYKDYNLSQLLRKPAFVSEDERIPPIDLKEQAKIKWDDEDVDEDDVKESWEDEDEPAPVCFMI